MISELTAADSIICKHKRQIRAWIRRALVVNSQHLTTFKLCNHSERQEQPSNFLITGLICEITIAYGLDPTLKAEWHLFP